MSQRNKGNYFDENACLVAEEALQFEHRDIHWGNIVVRTTEVKFLEYKISDRLKNVETRGVLASIIDYSLSRLTCPKDGTIIYNDASQDPTLFTGTGDYQFDIYRYFSLIDFSSQMKLKVKN